MHGYDGTFGDMTKGAGRFAAGRPSISSLCTILKDELLEIWKHEILLFGIIINITRDYGDILDMFLEYRMKVVRVCKLKPRRKPFHLD